MPIHNWNVRGIDYFGLTVPDLEAAVAFFVGALGCHELYRLGPFQADDDWMARRLGVDRAAIIPAIVVLACGTGSRLKLFHYAAPDQDTRLPRNSDLGGHHVAFYVEDMEQALRTVRSFGAEVLDQPTVMSDGPSAGETWAYVRTPWGSQIELVHRRGGFRGGEADGS
jgi:catechol 2,3-dioxygenase-like lactoylglutathione lyase family enzyme